MPAAHWEAFRLGAQLGAVRDLVSDPVSRDLSGRLQRALSAVAVDRTGGLPGALLWPPTEDDRFIGRLLLGLLTRGWPTLSSPEVERPSLDSVDPMSGLTVREMNRPGAIGWRLDPDAVSTLRPWNGLIKRAMLFGDPRLSIADAEVNASCDSEAEREFYQDVLAPLLGRSIGWLELQRPLASMIREDIESPEAAWKKYGSQRVDFALELPGPDGSIKFVIELDGPHHLEFEQRQIDKRRDKLLEKHGWTVLRVSTDPADPFRETLKTTLAEIVASNPIPFSLIDGDDADLDDPRLREALRLVLTPHAVARVQLAVALALLDGGLSLRKPSWDIAVVEREVPCARLALQDALAALAHLCRLYGVEVETKEVVLRVGGAHLASWTPPSIEAPSQAPVVMVVPLGGAGAGSVADLLVDVAVLAHPTRDYDDGTVEPRLPAARRSVVSRTAQRQSGYAVLPWPAPRPVLAPEAHRETLTYFLQTLFRKQAFRDGQTPIIERALRRENVLGLLPTGAGKSLTYQLPAFLSPGLTLVIDPLKSLMQDQVDNLAEIGVDDAIQINSDTPPTERERIEWQFARGEYRFVFISPERLQIKKFRDLLATTAKSRPVAALVIDETHCVSEWGHDFRIAYLNLGRIARQFCAGPDGAPPPIVALTGTASEAVLLDVRRELDLQPEDVKRPDNFKREELLFQVIPIRRPEKGYALVRWLGHELPKNLGVDPDVLASGACGGLVFCPHVKGELGVYDVHNAIKDALPYFADGDGEDVEEVGIYSGEAPPLLMLTDDEWAERKARTQRDFKAGRLSLLVATSAFGMGIDKPNIRYTVHYGMPKSVEAFAQEAGRAGRDRKRAYCAVLFSDRLDSSAANGAGADLPADCLEPGISAEEAFKRTQQAGKFNQDDAENQIFLHAKGYKGVAIESKAVRALYRVKIQPELANANVACIILPEGELRALQDQQDGSLEEDDGEAQDKDADKRVDAQRIIYRLSCLGIVEDYTVKYQRAGNLYLLTVRRLSPEALLNNLRAYVDRYKTADWFRIVEQRIEASEIADPAERTIDALVWFVYEEIEKQRRTAMYNMRRILRESTSGEDLARQIDAMLSGGALTNSVFDLLKHDDDHHWWRVAEGIQTAQGFDDLLGRCRRALETDPDHPGLRVLSGIAYAARSSPDLAEAAQFVDLGIRKVAELRSASETIEVAGRVVRHVYSAVTTPGHADALLRGVAIDRRNEPIARAAFVAASDPDLKRDCAWPFVASIAAMTADLVASHLEA